MKTIEQIEGTPIHGNAYSDSGLMREIHAFVTGDAPTDEKLRALAVLDRVMGAEGGRPTKADLDEYLQQSDAYFAVEDDEPATDRDRAYGPGRY